MTHIIDTHHLFNTFSGTLHTPDSAGYDEARSIWNGQIDRRPVLVATCATTEDVAAVVRHSVENQVPLSVRAGGHHVAGSAIVEDGIVIDLSKMTRVRLDAANHRAYVQGGAKLGDLDAGTLPYGHLTPAGIDADTGVGGLTLGGGVGWNMRKLGLTCDNLTGVTLVTAEGEIIHATEASDSELLWGLRGGGGNFGIVTEFEFETHQIPDEVLAGFAVYRGEDVTTVLRSYRDIIADAPDELTTIVIMRIAPGLDWLPAEVVGNPIIMIGAVFCGDPAEAESVISPLRALGPVVVDTIAPKAMIDHQGVLVGANPVGHRYYWKSSPIDRLTDEVIDLFQRHTNTVSSPHSLLSFFHLGGAVARNADIGCFPNRDAGFLINYACQWIDESEDDLHRDWTKAAMAEFEPHIIGGGYVNFLSEQGLDAVRQAYGDSRFERLTSLKARMDPGNVFRHNQNIPPASEPTRQSG